MKKTLLIIITFVLCNTSFAQKESAFEKGEWFNFKMSYSGWMKAGEATLKVNEDVIDGKPVYHVGFLRLKIATKAILIKKNLSHTDL